MAAKTGRKKKMKRPKGALERGEEVKEEGYEIEVDVHGGIGIGSRDVHG